MTKCWSLQQWLRHITTSGRRVANEVDSLTRDTGAKIPVLFWYGQIWAIWPVPQGGFAGPKAGSLRWKDHRCPHSCPKPRCRVRKTQQVATDFMIIYCSPTKIHTLPIDLQQLHLSDPPDLWHFHHRQGAESETNFGRYETVPEDGGQAMGID